VNKHIPLITVLGVSVVTAAVGFLVGITSSGSNFANAIENFFAKSSSQNSELPADLNYAEVERLYDELRQNYYGELNVDDLLNGAKEGLAKATGDPYTVYLDAEEAQQFNSSLNNEFSGIGAEIAVKNDILQVVTPLEDTPASKAGLRPGDLIALIDGESSDGLSVEQAVIKIRGEKGTDVTLTIVRDGESREITITRDDIDVPNAESEILEGNIGYVDLGTFGNDAVAETRAIAEEFKRQNVEGVILDLRNNSGGLLTAAVDIAGLWLDGDVVVDQRGAQELKLSSSPNGVLRGIPTVVLVNGGSASASEIVAGALQDYGVATILGETTFGKGSVQQLETFRDGSELKVTVARWFTPQGMNIDEEGIVPDVEVEFTEEDFDADRDPQLDRALKTLQ